jgi:signal transduction histidine kinase
MALANAQARAELAASRARLVATADDARRRIERDLHDGVQQRLITLGLEARVAQGVAASEGSAELQARLDRLAEGLTAAFDELREVALGIHPAILAHGGLTAAVQTLARRSAIPVTAELPTGLDLPERVEVAAYYVVSEALNNAVKHSQASSVEVDGVLHDHLLELSIRDDGVGGASLGEGSGLIGLSDRVEALGGRLELTSPPGRGTEVHVMLPTGGA